jgi:PAS domain S-box-containing protein
MMSKMAAMNCLAGGGEMGALMREYDWSASPVGPVSEWPQSLKTSVSTCLNSRFAVVLWWGPSLVTFYNDAYRQIIGQKHPRALGAPAWEVWPEIWQIIEPMLKGVMERGEATWADDLLLELNRNGYPEECYFTFSYGPIRDEAGNVGGVFTPVQETTERVIGERRLRTLSDLASGARAANAQTVEEVCRVVMETLARNPYDVPFASLYLDGETAGTAGIEPDAELVRILARAGEGVEPLTPDAQAPCGAWRAPCTEVMVLPILPVGQRAGFLAAGISPRKRLDEAYRDFLQMIAGHIATAVGEARAAEDERRRTAALAELDRAKTVFFSNISHEFRTPLMLMLGPIEDALADGRTDRERLETVRRNGQRLRKLVDNLLDFSRIEAGRIEASYEPVDMAALTAELASTFRSAVEKAGLRLTVDCPDLGEPVYVDREMWEKIVLNLLSNAFKYTLEGGIDVSLRKAGGNVELVVKDTGIGIAKADLTRVFDRFYRVEGARGRSVEGSGIGLSMVRELVRLHSGTVRAESEQGHGTTITISLPTGATHLPEQRVRRTSSGSTTVYSDEAARWLQPEPPSEPQVEPGLRPRVLLADDNADMRAYIARLLGPAYEVNVVADGREALARIGENPPDLVLTDVMMAEMDGFELLRAIRSDARTRALPVIVLSARASEDARLEGLTHGADDYLTKPFTARELLARVEGRLELARARRAALRQLETVMENTPAGIALVSGGEYRFEWLNAAYRALAPEREMLGRTFDEVWPEVADELKQQMRQVLETGEPYEVTDAVYKIQRKQGTSEKRYFSYSLVRLDLPDGSGSGVLVTCVETTALRVTNDRLERVLASITDGYYALDADWRFLAMNPIASEIIGVAPAEAIGRDFLEVTKLSPQLLVYARMSRVMALRKPDHFEGESQIRPGKWYEVHLYPRDEGGLEVYFRDITDRKRSEQAMRESEERFRRLFDANIVGIICADREKIYEANDAFLEMMGETREEFATAGLPWRKMTPPEHLSRDEEAMREMLATGSFRPFEKEYVRRDGTRVPILLGGSLLRESPLECICFILDLTERKQLERRVLEAQKLESLGVLAGGMAHDFNNLLVGVLGNASLAKEMLPEQHPASELLDAVVTASEHAALLTKQMLAYSGKGRFLLEPVDFTELVEEIIPIVQPSISKKVTVSTELQERLPAVEADRSQMQQIVTNLLLNASEAIGDTHGSITVRTGLRIVEAAETIQAGNLATGIYVWLEVEDTGCGMNEATKRRVFDPFFTTKFTGRGLGLAAVAGIVRGHQGTIRVVSEPGRGSRFTVYLPATSRPAAPWIETEEPAERLQGAGKILVVDDEAVVRSMAKRGLERYGYEVELAESGPEAVEAVRAGGVDAVLLDLSMPGMSGQETLVELRKLNARLPVLLSSGYNEAETMRLFVGMDVAGFIQKPYSSPHLAKRIKATLEDTNSAADERR